MVAVAERVELAETHKLFGVRVTPLTLRRWRNFKHNRRGYVSLWIFLVLFGLSLCAELIANDRPILMGYEGRLYAPIFQTIPETTFKGGMFETQADFRDPAVQHMIEADGGWTVWPPIPFSYRTIDWDTRTAAPGPPTSRNWLGTDNQARDVLARVIYGFRVSVLFGMGVTLLSAVIGVVAGAVQGYFGGAVDLVLQRFIEILANLPTLLLLIILASLVRPSFFWLMGFMLVFSWMGLTPLVRAEFLRARNFEYVRAARALGVGDGPIMYRHVLPNAMVATLTFLPFMLNGAIAALTALDFLGFGLPPGSPSLGELLNEARNNLQAPWLAATGFAVMGLMLSLLIFIGEAVRDAFDPRKTF
jgi:microcin C transport system permease protein